jgi:signal transduction histidine kinase
LDVSSGAPPYGEDVRIAVRLPQKTSPLLVDVLVAGAVAVPVSLDAWWNEPGTRQADAVTYLLVVVSIGGLLVRRRWPVAVAAVCGAAVTAWYLLGHHGEALSVPTMVALYTVAAQGNRRRTTWVGVVAVVWSAAVSSGADPSGFPVAESVWPLLALLLGEVVRGRRELREEYAARAVRAAAERGQEARRRVEEERLRIARELHDIVAHTVTAMNVQAGLAADALDARPELARGALAQVRASGREAVRELHAVVSVLRAEGGNGSTLPAPRLSQLEDLVERTTGTGLTVTLRRETGERALPAVVELAAYRIVQEALTNVIRHAGARHALVSVIRENGVVIVEVTDDGTAGDGAGPAAVPVRGFGLIGMGERAAAVGGTVEHGPRPDGGFRVRAVLPVDGVHA